MTPEKLAELRRLEKLATPRPWEAEKTLGAPEVICWEDLLGRIKLRIAKALMNRGSEDLKQACDNADLIAVMRNHLPELLDAADNTSLLRQYCDRDRNEMRSLAYEIYLANDRLSRQLQVLSEEITELRGDK